jgi:hypothetical protein
VTNAFSGLLVFFLISGIWIGLLTNKYHTFTISTAGDYNFSFIRPGSPGQIVDTGGVMPPPNETAVSAWEDPTYIKKVPWSPFNSGKDFFHLIKNTAKNAGTYLLYLKRKPVIFFTIISFVIILIPLRLTSVDKKPFYLFLTTILQPLGYLILLMEERYVWINFILLYILSAYLIDTILTNIVITKARKYALVSIICGYIALWPIASLFYYASSEVDLPHLKKIYFTSRELTKYRDFQDTNIASQGDNWSDDLYLSYYLEARYYGKVKEGITDEELKKKLINHDIDYYFVHNELKNHIDILKPLKKFGELTIYMVAKPEL